MLTLMLKLCLAGQPCKEIRIADFYSAQASFMCSFNRDAMTEQAKREKRGGTFECRSDQPEYPWPALAELKFKVCGADGACTEFALAKFYGNESAAPMCAQNAAYMRPGFDQAGKEAKAKVTLDCHS